MQGYTPDMSMFSQVPRSLLAALSDLELPPSARIALVALRSFCRAPGQWWQVRQRVLAHASGLAYSTLRRGLGLLVAAGVVTSRPVYGEDGRQCSNEYQILLWPAEDASQSMQGAPPRDDPDPAPAPPEASLKSLPNDDTADVREFLKLVITNWGDAKRDGGAYYTNEWEQLVVGNFELAAHIDRAIAAHPLTRGMGKRAVGRILRQITRSARVARNLEEARAQ